MRGLNPKIYSKEYYLNSCLGFEEYKKFKAKKVHPRIIEFCDLLEIKKGMKVLDLGCGRGDLAIECARRGAIVYGIDYSKDGIMLAKQALKKQSKTIQKNVSFSVMNAKKLEFSDDTFDIITSFDVFEHLFKDELEKVMQELSRVLQSGGILAVHTETNKIYLDFTHHIWTYPINILLIRLNKLLTKKDYPGLPADPRNDLHKQQHVNEPTYFYLNTLFKRHGFKGRILSLVPFKPVLSWKDSLYNILVWQYPFSNFPPFNLLFTTDYICTMKNIKRARKLKIAVFHELHHGGARKAANEISKGLKKNHQVDLYTVEEKKNIKEKNFYNNIYTYKFIDKKWTGHNWKIRLYKDTIELLKLYFLHKRIATEINKKEYDLVFVHPSQYTQTPFILRFLKRKTFYYCEETLRRAYESDLILKKNMYFTKRMYEYFSMGIRKILDKKNFESANIILANSKFTHENIKLAYNKNSIVSYLGVDASIYRPKNYKKKIDILYIGAKDTTDGYFLLEEALTYIKRKIIVKFHITDSDWLENENDLVKLYQYSKIVVCLAKNEPFGLLPLEAMACGVPVIAVAQGGHNETVEDGQTGYLIKRDAHELAKKIEDLLSNETLRIQLGKEARNHVINNWSWQKSIQSIEKIIST